MALRSGFWDSIDGDRRYSAKDMAIPFDGVISEGVFQNWGDTFKPLVSNDDNEITIGTGKAWISGRWILNDSVYHLEESASNLADSVSPKTYVVCLDLKVEAYNRYAQFRIVHQDYYASWADMMAVLTNRAAGSNSLPLFSINLAPGDMHFTQSQITNYVGSAYCPYVTSPVQTVTVDDIRNLWSEKLSQEFDSITMMAQNKATEAENNFESQFNTWFGQLKNQLTANQAANLQNQLMDLQNKFASLVSTGSVEDKIEAYKDGLVPLTDSAGHDITARIVLAKEK